MTKNWLRKTVRNLTLASVAAASLPAANNYLVHNLVSDLPNTADQVDKKLVNPWGIAASATGPFWVGNNHSGTSTLYTGAGVPNSLVVTVPSHGGTATPGPVTGVIFNGTQLFTVDTGKPSSFIFCTEDGTISGWNSSFDATHAKILIDNSASGAVYKGCALGGTATSPVLYAANFKSGAIDSWGPDLKLIQSSGAFQDSQVPSGFAPFNIQNLGGTLYVTYAKQSDDKMDDVPGTGNGYLAAFDMTGKLLLHLASQGPLNSPWGLAVAPASFGDFGKALLVGNFGDGTIHAFNASTGALLGTLNDLKGQPIVIKGLWALLAGNGGRGGDSSTLYFTAGIPGTTGEPVESHGLLGSVQAAPSFLVTGIANAASFSTTLAANTWATIAGGALSGSTRSWAGKDFVGNKLPVTLDGVGVTVNGQPAYVSYVSPSQINFLLPTDVPTGPVQIQTTNNGLTSASATATLQPVAPSFFPLGATKYVAATHADGVSLVGPPSLITGATTTPAKIGETVVIYGNGFGPTSPATPNGQVVNTPLTLSAAPTITIGGMPTLVQYAGLTASGLYQFNVVVPAIATGDAAMVDAAVVAQVSGAQSQPNIFLSVAPAPKAQTLAVDIVNFAFAPDPVNVAAGSQIVWTNKDGATHTVVADNNKFKSDSLAQGIAFTQKLDTPGTYAYHCSIHPFMKGTIVVK